MKAVFTVEIPDDALESRCRAFQRDHGVLIGTPAEYFAERCLEVADDELVLAFYGLPVETSVTVTP